MKYINQFLIFIILISVYSTKRIRNLKSQSKLLRPDQGDEVEFETEEEMKKRTSVVVKIKLISPKSSKYLYTIKDYDNFEFLSPVNPWDVQNQFKSDFDKLKTLEVTLNKGQIIFILVEEFIYSTWE